MFPALLGFTALLQTATPLATPDWRVVAYGTDGSQVSTDLDRLSCMGALCSATEMTEYLHPTPTGVTRSVDDVQYDCEKATTRTLAETSFDVRGRQLEHLNAPTAWALLEADTIGFQALAYVCSPRTAERKTAGEVATVSTSASGPTAPAPKTLSSNHDDAATVQIASSPTADQARSALAALDRGHPEAATFEAHVEKATVRGRITYRALIAGFATQAAAAAFCQQLQNPGGCLVRAVKGPR